MNSSAGSKLYDTGEEKILTAAKARSDWKFAVRMKCCAKQTVQTPQLLHSNVRVDKTFDNLSREMKSIDFGSDFSIIIFSSAR